MREDLRIRNVLIVIGYSFALTAIGLYIESVYGIDLRWKTTPEKVYGIMSYMAVLPPFWLGVEFLLAWWRDVDVEVTGADS